MFQQKPFFLIRKYHSILVAAIVVEAVSFLVSLTDSIVAANMVSETAFAAIGIMSPFFSISVFITATINSGTVLNFSEQIGSFNKKRAFEFFSEGVIFALASGAVYTVVLILIKKPFIDSQVITPETALALSEYYDLIIFYFMMSPISALLDNIVIADGGEKLSAVSNSIQIVGNIVLSYALSVPLGITGVAAATVICKALFIVIILFWFFGKRNSIRFVRYFSFKACMNIVSKGIVRASTFAMTAIMTIILNSIVLNNYGEDAFLILTSTLKIMGLTSIFLGLSMAIQPLVGTLQGENNTKAERFLLRRASIDILLIGVITAVLVQVFAPFIVTAFGLKDPLLFEDAVFAARITGIYLAFSAVMVFFFICYFLLGKKILAITVSVIKDFLVPIILAESIVILFDRMRAFWFGLAFSSVIAFIICALIILIRFGRPLFPYLIPRENDRTIYIYDFIIDDKTAVAMSATAAEVLKESGYTCHLQTLVSVYIEDILMLIKEKNSGAKKEVSAECTLILNNSNVRVIFRDSGVVFDVSDSDALPDSFRQFIVANMMESHRNKIYMVTTGYNRIELDFRENQI